MPEDGSGLSELEGDAGLSSAVLPLGVESGVEDGAGLPFTMLPLGLLGVEAGVEEGAAGSSSQSPSSDPPGEMVEVAYAALADARAAAEGAQSGARSSFKFSVANMGWQHLSK